MHNIHGLIVVIMLHCLYANNNSIIYKLSEAVTDVEVAVPLGRKGTELLARTDVGAVDACTVAYDGIAPRIVERETEQRSEFRRAVA